MEEYLIGGHAVTAVMIPIPTRNVIAQPDRATQ
jgi:hypothetical protein